MSIVTINCIKCLIIRYQIGHEESSRSPKCQSIKNSKTGGKSSGTEDWSESIKSLDTDEGIKLEPEEMAKVSK